MKRPSHAKPFLPSKTCAVCGRPFVWRKKWAKVWEEVRYCSEACRKRRAQASRPSPAGLREGDGR